MRTSTIVILSAVMVFLASCTPDYDVVFPEEIPFGTNLIYIDGELTDFRNNTFYHLTSDSLELLRLAFVQKLASSHINQLKASTYFPEENSDYSISEQITKNPGIVAVSFSQSYDEDLEGWEYKYCRTKDDFFRFDIIDTTNQVMAGRANLRFKRTKKHGVPGDAGIDKVIYIEMAFHDFFEIK